jgi:serine/threonine protein phosphatase 1
MNISYILESSNTLTVERKIIIGDIHGCFKTLKKLLEEKIPITKEDHLYFVGDFIDRGPSSREVLDYLIDLKWRGYHINPIIGNHEDMLLKAINDESYLQAWFNNGAESTLQSFDIPPEEVFDYESLRKIPDRYLQFISTMPLYYEDDDMVICHAGLNFEIEKPFSDIQSMLWIRDFRYKPEKIGNRILIHGHTPMPLIDIEYTLRDKNSKVINLDAGCVYKELPGYGKLIAFNPETREYYLQENIDFFAPDIA